MNENSVYRYKQKPNIHLRRRLNSLTDKGLSHAKEFKFDSVLGCKNEEKDITVEKNFSMYN